MEEIFKIFKLSLISLVSPSSFLCIDETLYACRCRCNFIQLIKSKPAKYGIKYWCLVDVSTGVLVDFNIYLGKKKKLNSLLLK